MLASAGYTPPELIMMSAGMSYADYKKLKEEDEEELARLYFFVLEGKKKEKEELERLKDQNQPSQGTRYVSGD